MTSSKTLFLAAVTALSLGMGVAYAQSEVPAAGAPYWTLDRQADALRQVQARQIGRVQAGSSDVERGSHTVPFNGNFGTLANPG